MEEALRDRIVHGLRDTNLKKILFQEEELNYTKMIQIINSWEGTRISMETDQKANPKSSVHFIQNRSSCTRNTQKEKERLECKCCGYDNHVSERCRFKTYKCNKCSEVGHLARMCNNDDNTAGTGSYYTEDVSLLMNWKICIPSERSAVSSMSSIIYVLVWVEIIVWLFELRRLRQGLIMVSVFRRITGNISS